MFDQSQSKMIENANQIVIFHFYFLNMDISLTIRPFELRFCVCNSNNPLEGSVSQNFDLGPTFYFMSKNG